MDPVKVKIVNRSNNALPAYGTSESAGMAKRAHSASAAAASVGANGRKHRVASRL